MVSNNYIRLSRWAAQHGKHRMTAWRHYHVGTLPPEHHPRKIASIIYVLASPEAPAGRIVGYAPVSSAGQKPHLENQANRLWAYAGQNGILLNDVVSDTASGLNNRRPHLRKLLVDPAVQAVIVGHRERLARFGVGMVETMLRVRGGSLVVIDDAEVPDDLVPDDLVRDLTEILTCFCARLYGKGSAANKARRATEAVGG